MGRTLKAAMGSIIAVALGLAAGIGSGCGDSPEPPKAQKARAAQKSRPTSRAQILESRYSASLKGIELTDAQEGQVEKIKLEAEARRGEFESVRARMKKARAEKDEKAQKELAEELRELRSREDSIDQLRALLDETQAQVLDANVKEWQEKYSPQRGRAG